MTTMTPAAQSIARVLFPETPSKGRVYNFSAGPAVMPETVLEQILTGTFADGLGQVRKDPTRVDFDPFPWQSFAIWILTQMKRWGQIKGDVNYKAIAEQVYLATDTTRLMKEAGLTPPTSTMKTFSVMGKPFDPEKPEDYLASFKIKRS
jgi:nitrate/nitrite transport system substrate-binding protein